MRRVSVVLCAGALVFARTAGAAETNGVRWIDGRDLPLEGRAFGDTATYYERLPAEIPTNVNAGVRRRKSDTAGLQFRFVTDSRTLDFRWTPTSTNLAMDHLAATAKSGIDVYRFDAGKGSWRHAGTGRITDAARGGALRLGWTPGEPCLVYLPLYNGLRGLRLGIEPGTCVTSAPPRASGVTRPVVFYGTSITQGACASRPGQAFVNIVGRELDVPVVNLGFSSSGLMEPEMADLLAEIDASCYVLDCLWNMVDDWPRYRTNYEPFVRRLRARRPAVPIVLVGKSDASGGGDSDPDVFVKDLFGRFLAEGWTHLHHLPKTGLLPEDGDGTVDGCHPNDWGMKRLAAHFGRILRQALMLDPLPLVPAPRRLVRRDGCADATNVTVRTDPSLGAESYRLTVGTNGAEIVAADAAGAFYAQKTLEQLPKPWPCLRIEDSPAYRWRGLHLDESRHFFGKETVRDLLDRMAAYKFNVFHWHLTDDQGWRIDVPGYPELIRYGAVRSASPRHGTHPSRGTVTDNAAALNGTRYGPFYYTEADLREIVEYAAARHIAVVPEIELPGHVYAALAAYPEFACRPENLSARDPRTIWGIEKDVLCVGNPEAISFLEDVLDFVSRVFPSPYVHIGGDECPHERWRACARCRAFAERKGLAGTDGLQAWVTRHFVRFLSERGKRAVGWDECLGGDAPTNMVGMCWRDPSCVGAGQPIVSFVDALARGHEMVMTPNSYCYLDYNQGLKDDPYQYARRTLTLEHAYGFDPCRGIPEHLHSRILGGQGNNWTEYTWNEYDLMWKVWPRAAALSECLWTGNSRPGFDDFRRRLHACGGSR